MPSSPKAAAVLYAIDLTRVAGFYANVAGLQVTHAERAHIVLESEALQLVIVAVPRKVAASIHLTQPPQRREDTAIKLVFPVADLAAARQAAQSQGGQIDEPEREWLFQDSRVCDGHDPEGNVVQLREPARQPSDEDDARRAPPEQASPETKGVTTELLASLDLGAEIAGMAGRILRMRRVTIEPGGVFGPVHDHKDRPGMVYVLQGTITDHRGGVSTDYGPGAGWPEDRNTTHWLENRGTTTAVEVSIDIARQDPAAPDCIGNID